ncbi:hypothetical protein [Clostridium peptidivorans]|uniref:hypothetical protein n=1 Tax=Clostridium peptidivorans TaxID=100174 RepID=UPI0015C8A8E2|nr:hypothetical protein [Clostridium peptidivorans]
MLRTLLCQRGIVLNKELSNMVVEDIKFNNINFNKKTSLKELLIIIERCDFVLKRCV